MKISIDTKEDSHDEIRKVIRMLSHLVGDSAAFNEAQQQHQPSDPEIPQEGLFNLFQEEKNQVNTPEPVKKDPDDRPELIPY